MRVRRFCHTLLQLCGLVGLAACAAISKPQDAPQTAATIVPSDGVSVRLEQRGEALLLEITSETGIGSAQVTLSDLPASQDVILRLHLKGLEELRFEYPGAVVTASVSSSDMTVREQAQPSAATSPQTISPRSPYWMEIGILREQTGATPTIPLPDGYFDVSVPRDFLRGGTGSFTVSWVDFYR